MTSVEKKDQNLDSVVRSSFLKTALIPILTLELVLLCLYFYSTYYITERNLNLLRTNAHEVVSEISKSEAKNFENQLREISRNSRSLQLEHQALYNNAFSSPAIEDKLQLESTDELSEYLNSGDSSVFVSTRTALTPSVRDKVIKTEIMDVRFTTLVDENPNLVSAYFMSWDNLIRSYPTIESFYSKFSPDFDMTKYNFYYGADAKHNPERKAVWTNAYLDPAGKGWMLSSLVPIYKKGFLEGVTGLDVTLRTFSKHILSNHLQWDSGALVMDKHGNILTMSRAAESYLGLTDISDYNYKDNPVDQALTKSTKFNLLKQSTLAGIYFSEFFNGSEQSMELTLQGEEYLLTKQVIPETGWQLFILAPFKQVYGAIIAEKQKMTDLGIIFLGFSAFFYGLFYVYLKWSSKRLAKRITTPVAQVAHMITTFDSDENTQVAHHKPVNITELDDLLSMNFNIQKSKIRYQKISKEMKIKNEQLRMLAITDQLTQVYNRLKLDEVLQYEMARAQRDNLPLTIAIMDIDKFKLVNDTFGHQAGDSVLIGIAQIMLKNIRSTDILGRWGGEEFLLILPNTSLENAYEHADQLRQLIGEANFPPVKQLTMSMGLASCTQFECSKQLVGHADIALYRAKENGRNCVEVALVEGAKSEKFLIKIAS